MAGVYVHIPFCSSFCIYCDFFSVLERGQKLKEDYISSLLREADNKKDFFDGVNISTLYFGGGTPSLLSSSQIGKVAEKINSLFGAPQEFTVEVNPDDVTLEYALSLRSVGVNRISMGVQSFNDAHLKWMRRRHTSSEAVSSFNILRKAGFDNISLDLIFGYFIPEIDISQERSYELWCNDLETLVSLHPEHVSTYQMSIEPGSALGAMSAKGGTSASYCEPSQEFCASQYSALQQYLGDAGYAQYEVSNFSLPGRQSRHNTSYWEREPYLGIGAAAHSFKGRNRFWNPQDIAAYIKGVDCGSEELTDEQVFMERIMLGLRKVEGVKLLPSEEMSLSKKIADLEKRGLLVYQNGILRIPKGNLFISDYIIGELI